MTLTQIIAEMEKGGRVPAINLEAHKRTLEALVELANRLTALENAIKPKK